MTITFRGMAASVLAIALAVLPAGAEQTDSAVFNLSLKGIYAGSLTLEGQSDGQSYAATGVLKSGGLVALVRKVRYDARANGTVRTGKFVPDRYEEDADTGKRRSKSVMAYADGVPQVTAYDPPRAAFDTDVDPATQGGTVDPLTALYAALRDTPEAEACKLHLYMFDGRRRSQVVLSQPKPDGDSVVCIGEYRRLAGFAAHEMAEKQRFPFRLIYRRTGEGMLRAEEIVMDTLYGKGRLKRR
ncbi:MAG: DUF3108 domain-containing protein [Rhodobacteraceae bacterium]|nr:DUF3108 domain-containing protein [Paracoccaceae bacterium]